MLIALAPSIISRLIVREPHDPKIPCISTLKMLQGAKDTWALENHKTTNDAPTDAEIFGEASYIREKPKCPLNGTYTLGAVSEKPRCSIPGHTI
jgi:hypothetical protein